MSSGSPAVVGKSAPLQQPFIGSVGAFCGIIRARNPRWSEYIALWLRSPVFLEWRDSQARGANIQNLRFSQFESLAIRTPPDHERDAFAGRLRSQLDAAARMRTACEVQATSIAHAESAMIRTAFGAPEVAGVERVALGTLCAIKAPLVDPTLAEYGGLPHVSGENIESGTGRLLEVRSASDDGMMSGKYLFEPGSVLYSKLRPYLRKAAAADFRGLCSADMYPLRPLDDRLDARFLKWLLLSDEFTVYADEESRRARMPKLNRRQLFSWLAPLPSIADQGRIAETLQRRLDAAGVIRVLIEEQAAEICRLPAAILHPAFSC